MEAAERHVRRRTIMIANCTVVATYVVIDEPRVRAPCGAVPLRLELLEVSATGSRWADCNSADTSRASTTERSDVDCNNAPCRQSQIYDKCDNKLTDGSVDIGHDTLARSNRRSGCVAVGELNTISSYDSCPETPLPNVCSRYDAAATQSCCT